jgi:Leucine-rich repeat (LRR) protein
MRKVFGLVIMLFLFCLVQAQKKDKTYLSIEQALKDPTHVVILNLKGQSIRVLPDDIIKLVNLEHLDLSYNSFTSVPPQVFRLPKLRVLNLNNNVITELPNMAPLHALTTLRLDVNPFTNPVAELKKVAAINSLTSLNFSANKLNAFPDELLGMVNLSELDLGYGGIKTLPANIDKLQNLRRLVLTKNLITTFPAAFFKLPKLENLDLSYNDFKTLQPEFVNLHLNVLDISFNKSLTAIPPIKDIRYANVKSTKVDVEKLKWALGEGCMIMN